MFRLWQLNLLYYNIYYQQQGDAKKPYFAQYSAVIEDSPVIKSCTFIKNNPPIKKILKPEKTNFNIFLIKINLLVVLNIYGEINNIYFYKTIIRHLSKWESQ